MVINTQKLNIWIKQHKLFAIATPIVLLLLIYFVTNSLNGMNTSLNDGEIKDGYNNSLPNQSNELEIKDPNSYFKDSIKDSLERNRAKVSINNIVGREKEKDSFAKILEELDTFSIDENAIKSNSYADKNLTSDNSRPSQTYSSKTKELTESEKKSEYRKMLQQARDERMARSQDYSAPSQKKAGFDNSKPNINVRASIYRDQFILPGKSVTLILNEDLFYKGNKFPKNTFVFATVNISQSIILLDIKKIGDTPISLSAEDVGNGKLGIYHEKAGELISEFYDDVQEGTVQGVSSELSNNIDAPMTKNAISAFNKYFRQKKRKQRDEILLTNGYKLRLISK